MSTLGKRRRRYHHGDLRRSLIAAGMVLLEQQGPAMISLRELARAAGVSHNAPYRHFPDRMALLAALATEGFHALRTRLAETAAHPDPRVRFQALGVAYVRFALENRGLYLLMFGGMIQPASHPELREAGDAAFDQLCQAVAAVDTPFAPRPATVSAWALAHGLAHLILDSQLRTDPEDVTHDKLVKAVMEVIVLGLSRSTAL